MTKNEFFTRFSKAILNEEFKLNDIRVLDLIFNYFFSGKSLSEVKRYLRENYAMSDEEVTRHIRRISNYLESQGLNMDEIKKKR